MSALTADELFADFAREFESRRFSAGLLVAFIDLLREVGAYGRGYHSLDQMLTGFPLVETSARGGRANALRIRARHEDGSERVVSIRPAYNRAEALFRLHHKRYDYPNCAPHATGQWRDYARWLDALVGLEASEAQRLAERVVAHVLAELPSHADLGPSRPPLERRFTRLLEAFDLTRQGREPAGAAFQGAIYAYIRADAPHLHLAVSRVGAGSKRLGRIADVDGWDGDRLVLSVEVKHEVLTDASAPALGPFLDAVRRHDALALVAAEGFTTEARRWIAESGGRPLDVPELLTVVELWDPIKQRAAVQAFTYYVHHIERSAPLIARLADFLASLD